MITFEVTNDLGLLQSRLQTALNAETIRQCNSLSLIASESISWAGVRDIGAHCFAHKYAEGYPGKRYYGGCEHADTVENLAIDAARALFGTRYANVQPLSGSNANLAIYLALLSPGDSVLGMSLRSGGHLTHGASKSFSGQWFSAHTYDVEPDGRIDYNKIAEIARAVQPKLIIAGVSAYPRKLWMDKFREIADSVGAYLLADIAHVAGLIAGKAYPSPFPSAHVATSTTHKTLRGPRGGMILCNDAGLAKKIDSALFPGTQGGPSIHSIAAKALTFTQDFGDYARSLIANARALAVGLRKHNIRLVADYDNLATDTHMLLLDLQSLGINGTTAQAMLESIGIVCNKNCIPHDPGGPLKPSGIRLGSTVITGRGMRSSDAEYLGDIIGRALRNTHPTEVLHQEVLRLCQKFPI
jgi:glycine hydroxymethyltransferase